MLIDKSTLEHLLKEAEKSPRRRAYLDLRNDAEECSQRMVVAVLPSDAKEVVHRHCDTSESLVLLQGNVTEIFYDEKGRETGRITLDSTLGNFMLQVPKGVFHTLIANTPSVFFEAKAGKYAPSRPEDLLTL